MKAKTMRKQYEKAIDKRMMNNYRALWFDLCRLPARTRRRLAWMMLTGNGNLDAAKRRKGGDNGKA